MTVSRRFPRFTFACLTACALILPATAHAQPSNPGEIHGFNPQPDPPGFGPFTLEAGQFVRLNVTCFDHQIGLSPPDPCRGVVMFHDVLGNVLVEDTYELQPGHSGFLPFALPPGDTVAPSLGIQPCVIPGPGGVAIPDVEIFDAATLLVVRHMNPSAARMSEFSNGGTDPGSIVGFNPQPDPPGFGLVTLRVDQAMLLHVSCFAHPVNGTPPDPCRGQIMFHNAVGDVFGLDTYELQPGEVTTFTFAPSPSEVGGPPLLAINPCILPQPGGRAAPAVEIVDRATGRVARHVDPAVPGMSQFQNR